MKAVGVLDTLVTIQAVTEAAGGSGFPVESVSTLRTIWANKDDRDGSERFSAEQWTAQRVVIFVIPFTEDMDPDTVDVPKTRRVVYSSRTYNIQSAVPVGRRHQIRLVTELKAG